jgi:hypothetical protein
MVESSAKAERRFLKALCKKIEFDSSDDKSSIANKLERAISSLPKSEFRNNLLKNLPQHAERLLASHSPKDAKVVKPTRKTKVPRSFNICTEGRCSESLELAREDSEFRSKLLASIFVPSQCLVQLVDASSAASNDPLVLLRRQLQCFQLDASGCMSGGLAVHLDRVVGSAEHIWTKITSVSEKEQNDGYFSQLKDVLNLIQHFLLHFSMRHRIGETTQAIELTSVFPTEFENGKEGVSTVADLVGYFVLFTALLSVRASEERLVSTSVSFILFFIRELPIQSLHSVVMRLDELPAKRMHSYLPVFEQVFLNRPLPVMDQLDPSQYFRYLQLTRKLSAFFTANPSTDKTKRSQLRELVSHASMAPMPPTLFGWLVQTLETSSLELSAELRRASRHSVSRVLMNAKLVSDKQLQILTELVVQSFGVSGEEEAAAAGESAEVESEAKDGPLFFIDQKGKDGDKGREGAEGSAAGKGSAQKRKRGGKKDVAEVEEALEKQIADGVAQMQNEEADAGKEGEPAWKGISRRGKRRSKSEDSESAEPTKAAGSASKIKRGSKRKDESDDGSDRDERPKAKAMTPAKPPARTPAKKAKTAKSAKSESKKAESSKKAPPKSSTKAPKSSTKALKSSTKAPKSITKSKDGESQPQRRTRSNSLLDN